MIGPFSIDSFYPAYTGIGEEFGVTALELQQLVSVYMAAFAVMSLVHGPVSDAVGRKPVMLVGLAVYIAAMLAVMVAPSFGTLLALRAVQGASAGAATIISRVVVRDMFEGAEAQKLMSRIMMIFSLAPAIAPVAGGWLLLLGPWRIIFAAVAAFAALGAVLMLLVVPETLPPQDRRPVRVGSMLAGIWRVGHDPALLRLATGSAFGFAAQFLYIAGAPIFVERLLGLGAQDYWVLFVPLILGMMAGAQAVAMLSDRMSRARMITLGYLGTIAAALVNLGLVAIAGPFDGLEPRVIAAVVGPMLLAFTVQLFFGPMQIEVMDVFPHDRGTAGSMATFFSLAMNALLAGAVAPLVMRSAVSLAEAVLVSVLVGFALWVWHLRSDRRAAVVEDAPVRA
ncbi:MFS transporter [Brachybacterium sp. EF45031]|nr:MFS transporter [Brachybacterium sillae]